MKTILMRTLNFIFDERLFFGLLIGFLVGGYLFTEQLVALDKIMVCQ